MMNGNALRSGNVMIITILAVVLVVLSHSEGLAALNPRGPSIDESFAATEISPRDTFRVYLKGSDPDGDMKFIHIWVNVAGRPTTPIRLRIDQDQQSSISGYLSLFNTKSLLVSNLFGPPITLSVSLEDRAGHRSEVMEFPVTFYLGASQEAAPVGLFEDRFLGRIPKMIFPNGIGL